MSEQVARITQQVKDGLASVDGLDIVAIDDYFVIHLEEAQALLNRRDYLITELAVGSPRPKKRFYNTEPPELE